MGPQDYLYAADTTNMQAGGKSFLSQVSDAITIGAPTAALSGFDSIYNTGVDVANFFGAHADRIDTQKQITDIDQNWGTYYAENKNVIDTVGFIGASLLPGGLAVKGLNLLRRGEAFGAFGRALNITTTKQTQALESALQTLASPEGSVFTRMNKDFLGALGWGVADNVLQTATFEIAVATTMKASPLLDSQSWKDTSYDILKTSLLGGVFAGGIEGLLMNRTLKDATTLIDRSGAKYKSMTDAFDRVNLTDSDKAASIMDAVLKLPKEVFEDDKLLDFTYRLNGTTKTLPLDVAALRSSDLHKTIKSGYLEFESIINNKLAEDPSVGKGFANALLKLVKDGKVAGKEDVDIRERLNDYLFNLDSIEAAQIGSVRPEDLFYFNKKGTLATGGPLVTSGVTGTPMRIVGDPTTLVSSLIGKDHASVKDAWTAGADIALKPNGEWSLNPASKRIRPTTEPSTYQTIMRLDSGETRETAILSAADIATAAAPLTPFDGGVRVADRVMKFALGKLPADDADSVELSARHLWASKLEKISGTISSDDFSILDKMSASKNIVDAKTLIETSPGVLPIPWKDLGNFDEFVFNNKISTLKNIMADGKEHDITELAYKLNTTPQWIQDVIASKFETGLTRVASGAPDLTTGWQRDLASYAERDNVVLNYKKAPALLPDDFGNTVETARYVPMADDFGSAFLGDVQGASSFITGSQAYAYRVSLAKDQLNNATASVLGAKDYGKLIDFTAEELAGLATRAGSGPGLTSFADANYGDKLGMLSQYVGKVVHGLSQDYSNAALVRIQPMLAAIKNSPVDAAELVAAVTKLRRSPDAYTLLGTEYGLDGTYMVNKNLLGKKPTEEVIANIRGASGTDGNVIHINSDSVAQLLREHMTITGERSAQRKVLLNAQGITSNISEDTLYAPPIDTKKVPYFAFVRPVDGKIFGDSNVSMITAKTPEELQRLAGQIDPTQFDVLFKKDTEAFFKAKGDYEYSRGLNESSINSSLQRDGKLGDFLPSFQAEDVLEDFVNFHQRGATQLVRDAVSTKYSQTFTELRRLSEQNTDAATSKAEPVGKFFQRTVPDPYGDYIKTALDISKRSEFTLLHQTNEFVDAVGVRAYRAADVAFRDAAAGKVSWEDANSTLTRYGLGAPYNSQHAYEVAQTGADRNLVKIALQKANMLLTTLTLRFDMANSLMNVISTPAMLGSELSSIRNSIKNNPELTGKLAELTSVGVPGEQAAIPSMSKLVFGAIRNFAGNDKKALLARYTDNLDVKGTLALYHEMTSDLSLLPKLVPSEFAKKADKWVERVAGGFGNNFAEQFTRFVSADVMRQLTEPLVVAGKMGVAEQNAYISVFVNRVQGNYIASQRPILFQGTLGSALGLFQTYQFNLLQQLFRHIEDRNLKTIAVMGGLQTSLFGLNGLPLFEAINTNIIGNANINSGHRDIYSTVTQGAGKELGDWLLYGTASALPLFGGQGPALYTRGDINPRHASVIPITPLDVPAVDASIRFVKNILNVGSKISAGGDVGAALMEGLEHNSVSRPLAGIAQVAQGFSTTGKGELISASNDFNAIANASRILGAKPLDESVGLNTKFRNKAYQAADRDKINTLGAVVRDKLRNGGTPSEEEFTGFMGQYAAAGGNTQNFSAAVQNWSKTANTSTLNELSDHLRSPYAQRFVEVMGGSRMEDFTDQ